MAQAIAIGFTSLILTNMYEVSSEANTTGTLSDLTSSNTFNDRN